MSTEQPPAVVRRGTNLDRVGGFNDTVVLDAIRRADEQLSRVEIAAATGLSGQAISNITRRLLDAGLVREAGRQKAPASANHGPCSSSNPPASTPSACISTRPSSPSSCSI